MNDYRLFFSPLVLAFIYMNHRNVKEATIKPPIVSVYSEYK